MTIIKALNIENSIFRNTIELGIINLLDLQMSRGNYLEFNLALHEEKCEFDPTKPLVINLTHSFAQLKVIQFLYSLITILCFYYFIILPA
ncbi:MAG: hypothetical protein ACTSRZ_16220, partial [Promethearchaeota archaeon]